MEYGSLFLSASADASWESFLVDFLQECQHEVPGRGDHKIAPMDLLVD
jgi:hypothetical protein